MVIILTSDPSHSKWVVKRFLRQKSNKHVKQFTVAVSVVGRRFSREKEAYREVHGCSLWQHEPCKEGQGRYEARTTFNNHLPFLSFLFVFWAYVKQKACFFSFFNGVRLPDNHSPNLNLLDLNGQRTFINDQIWQPVNHLLIEAHECIPLAML